MKGGPGMSKRPSIPAEIARQVLIQSGHRCAVCGAGCPLERAHIIPWHKSREHKAEYLICLCANCHQRADLERWGVKTLREYKRRPWVMRQYENTDSRPKPTTRLELTIQMEQEDFNEKNQRWLQYAIAAFLEIPPDAVRVASIEMGSVKVTIELPERDAERLLSAYRRDDSELVKYLYPLVLLNLHREVVRRERTRVKRILKQVSDTAAKLIDLDSFYVALLSETTGQLEFPFAVSNSHELETGKGKWAPRPYKGGAALPDYVIEIGHPVLAEPDLEGWMTANKVAYWEDQIPLSWLGAPMVVGTKVLGVLVAENYDKARAFDSGTSTVLSSIASRTATAIANARLYERLDRLNEVGQRLTSGIRLRRDEILELIYEQASQLMDTRNMYIALYDEETDMVSFGLAMQDGRRVHVEEEEGLAPRKAGKGRTEEIIRTQKSVLHRTKREAEEWYAEHVEYIGKIANSWLGVPMMVGEKVLGVIATYNWERENAYDKDDLEILQTMANQAAIAIDNAVLYYDINQKLRVLNEIGQRLTYGIRLRQDEILELIYEQASRLMDTRNMYIALYDEEADMVSFGRAMQGGRRVDVEREKGWAPRKAGKGATEEVIRTRKPILLGTRREAEEWYEKHAEYIGLVPNAWLGVPMMAGEKVLGVIAVRNHEQDNAYGWGDLKVLQTMAGQAATAMENARLYEQLEKRYIELETEYIAREQLAALGTATAALQHRVSNTLNLINPGIMRLRSRIDPNDKDATEILDIMERNVGYTSQIISRLQEPLKEEIATVTDVNSRLKEIVQDVREKEPEMCQRVSFNLDGLNPGIPRIEIGTGQLTEVFRNLVENACKAMQPQGGTLTLSNRLVDNTIEVEFQDTGPGIPPNILDRLFTRPVPPKDFGAGTGLGLWLSKLILQKYGGDIKVKETSDKGTTMLIRLPAIQQPTTQQAESEDVP
jgi:GAF domain-containing protein/anti-sigma regulatory factor (Ser/Thr protein kinase)